MRSGHSLSDIKNYSYSQFLMCLQAVSELDAEGRLNEVADLSVVVGSLFAKDSPVAGHLDDLNDIRRGVNHGDT